MKPTILLVLLLTACPKQVPVDDPHMACKSRCGMQLIGPVPPVDVGVFGEFTAQWTCANWDAAETLALLAFDKYIDKSKERSGRFVNACEHLNGWRVGIVATARYQSMGQEVSGRTNCAGGASSIGARPADQSALTHEMMHIIQRCEVWPKKTDCADGGPCDGAHIGWEEAGLFKADGESLQEGKRNPGNPWGIHFEMPTPETIR